MTRLIDTHDFSHGGKWCRRTACGYVRGAAVFVKCRGDKPRDRIVVWPDARLREETREVTEITGEIRELYRDLADTMYALNGLGIAAVQIGVPVKMFLVEPELAGRPKDGDPVAFINPEVVWVSDEVERAEEGCLSFPGIYVPVERPLSCRVRAMGIDGEVFEMEGEGLLARCMLHEMDHLNGRTLMTQCVGESWDELAAAWVRRVEAAVGCGVPIPMARVDRDTVETPRVLVFWSRGPRRFDLEIHPDGRAEWFASEREWDAHDPRAWNVEASEWDEHVSEVTAPMARILRAMFSAG